MTLFSLNAWQLALLFVPAVLNLLGIWDAYRHSFASPLERMLWMLLCVFVPFLGGVCYLLFGWRRARTLK
ncbi:MAG: PLD nuclease N-terminal domain-containing protein [Bilophila sp.]